MNYLIDIVKMGINTAAQIYKTITLNIFDVNVNMFDLIIGAVIITSIIYAFIVLVRK